MIFKVVEANCLSPNDSPNGHYSLVALIIIH